MDQAVSQGEWNCALMACGEQSVMIDFPLGEPMGIQHQEWPADSWGSLTKVTSFLLPVLYSLDREANNTQCHIGRCFKAGGAK